MDETVKPLRIPPQMRNYAEKHELTHLAQGLVSNLLIDQPDDPISYLIDLLQGSSLDTPRVMVLGPPAVGKYTLCKRLSAELQAVHVTTESLLQGQSELSALSEKDLPSELLVRILQQRLKEVDCLKKGWVLQGIPKTRLQALNLQQVGVLPKHVVMLEAPDDVLQERNQGRMVDPQTKADTYHQILNWPSDDTIAGRLQKGRSLSNEQLSEELQHHSCEVSGLRSAYQHVLKVISGDQSHADIYQQALAFVQTRHRSRPQRIVLLGPPGSGKSLQAQLLAETYKMVDVSCGRLLRSIAAGGSALGEDIQLYLDGGLPVPDSKVLQVLEERLSQEDCSSRGWVLHGFPKNLLQARSLQESQHEPNRVFFLEATDEVCLERITLQATDPVSGQRFHAVSNPAPTSEFHSRLQTRPQDGTEEVLRRLREYRELSDALKSVYPDAAHVDADPQPRSVFEALQSRLTTN
ncbi:adenylate kinase 8 isoform X3 [Oryzias latipes]|uniref:adenylate kinase 8 isoform X3 n=1 Tax=Oryzias latipes TaxID=8090 RepID=UPI000CE1BD3E|nr:adenylate kinase 8 isoform X3 [Oryzias latipes]